jgi:hypothetical protein
MMPKYYTGVGSRKTPILILKELVNIARRLDETGHILRSGGAAGADYAFDVGAKSKEIYGTANVPDWCFTEVKKYLLPNKPSFNLMKPYIQKLLARNMMQVLGRDGKTPSEFLVCWTPLGTEDGGTGYAIRCARAHGVKIYNLAKTEDKKEFYEFIEKIEK